MAHPTEQELLKVVREQGPWLLAQPGVARVGVELSSTTGDPTLKIYTKNMPPGIEQSIRNRLGRNIPVEFEELRPGDEGIPF
jgi:hypothetical protein